MCGCCEGAASYSLTCRIHSTEGPSYHVAVVKAVDHAPCKGPYLRRLVSVHLRMHPSAAVFVTWKGGGKTNTDTDPVFHFTSGKLVVQLMALMCQRQSLSELCHEQPKTPLGGDPHACQTLQLLPAHLICCMAQYFH